MDDWTEHAACRGMDVAVFFPRGGVGRASYVEARKACGRCPVRRACLEDVLEFEAKFASKKGKASNLRHGMQGGSTPDERQRMHWLWKIKEAA